MNEPQQIIRVAVAGSAVTHWGREGSFLTLCGRVAVIRRFVGTTFTTCRRCEMERAELARQARAAGS